MTERHEETIPKGRNRRAGIGDDKIKCREIRGVGFDGQARLSHELSVLRPQLPDARIGRG